MTTPLPHESFHVARSNKHNSEKLNITFTPNTLAQIIAASSCCSDSKNKRYSEKLEIAPKKLNH